MPEDWYRVGVRRGDLPPRTRRANQRAAVGRGGSGAHEGVVRHRRLSYPAALPLPICRCSATLTIKAFISGRAGGCASADSAGKLVAGVSLGGAKVWLERLRLVVGAVDAAPGADINRLGDGRVSGRCVMGRRGRTLRDGRDEIMIKPFAARDTGIRTISWRVAASITKSTTRAPSGAFRRRAAVGDWNGPRRRR